MSENKRLPRDVSVLSNELLLNILSMLDLDSILKIRITCRRFYIIASDPSLWPATLTWKCNGKFKHFNNMKLTLKLSKKSLEKLTLTNYSMPRCISRILPQINSCKSLQSITLTNFFFTMHQVNIFLNLPALSELHILSNNPINFIYQAVATAKCDLKVLTVSVNSYSYNDWGNAGYVPPDLRVLLTESGSIQSLKSHQYTKSEVRHGTAQHEAKVTFFQPMLKYVSLSSIPVLQFCFTPPNMDPSMYCFLTYGNTFDVAMIKHNLGFKLLPKRLKLHFPCKIKVCDTPCASMTSLPLFGNRRLASFHLQCIANKYPNLLHLDLQESKKYMNDLNGLNHISSLCSKLESLHLGYVKRYQAIDNVYLLWSMISQMHNLTTLVIPSYLIPKKPVSYILPALKAIHILCEAQVQIGIYTAPFNNEQFEFFSLMQSLKYFRFESIPFSRETSDLTNLLNTLPHLTHLYIDKTTRNGLTLPLDVRCYRNLENMYLSCDDFIFSDALANTISKCEHMKVLALKVSNVSVTSIVTMFDCLTLLSTFFVRMTAGSALASKRAAALFSNSLLKKSKEQGRIVDVLITIDDKVPLFNDIQKYVHFTL